MKLTAVALSLLVATVAVARPPLIKQYADPCSESCTFNLCTNVLRHPDEPLQIRTCPSGCGDVRVSLSATTSTGAVGPRPVRVRVGTAVVRLECLGVGRACWPCQSDADCDDGNPATRDVCLMPTFLGCGHACPDGPAQ